MIPHALSAFRAMLCLFLMASAIGLAQPVSAQTFPTQTITFQVAFAAGGIADVVARLVGQKLSERLGHAVVVENRGGAGGNLAAKSVSLAAPDGHTILATTTSLAVNETATRNKGFSADDLRAGRSARTCSPCIPAIRRRICGSSSRAGRASPTAAPGSAPVRISARNIFSARSLRFKPCTCRSPAARRRLQPPSATMSTRSC